MYCKFSRLFIFFIICQSFFSYNLKVKVEGPDGSPIKNTSVIINNFSKKTNQKGYVDFENINGEHNIYVYNENYSSIDIRKNFDSDDSITFVLNPIKHDFYIALFHGQELKYKKSNIKEFSQEIKGAIINIYSKGNLLYSLDYKGSYNGIQIPDGTYDFEIFTLFSAPYTIKDIKLKREENTYLNLYLPINFVKIKGKIKNENSLFGGVQIEFQNINNEKYEVYSNFDGSFEINLLPNMYKVEVNKAGYKLKKKYEFEFADSDITYNPEIELVQIPSSIEGYVFDTTGKAIVNTKLTISNNNKDITVYTDLNGFYKSEVEKGLVFIKALKDGYYPSGKIERVEAFSIKKIPDIVIQQKLASIEGILTNGVSPLKNIDVKLYDSQNTFVAKIKTNSKGFFSFDNIKALSDYHIIIDDSAYVYFQSENVYLDNNETKNINIILEDNNVNFVVELESEKIKDLENIKVVINEEMFSSDLNGIVNNKILSRKKIEKLNIYIPEFNIDSEYMTKNLGKEPYLIKIKLD